MNQHTTLVQVPTWKVLFIAFVPLIAGIWLGWQSLKAPEVTPASAPATMFSAERARQHLPAIASAPHPIGSPAQRQVRDYLVQQLHAAGLQPEIQRSMGVFEDHSPFVSAGAIENIVVRIEGTNPSHTILFAAHYDSVPYGPGANDDGVAVIAMLETIRALRAASPIRNTIIFLFTDGEEVGLLGASAFVREHPWARDVDVAFNFEARGASGPSLMFETSAQNAALIDEFIAAVPSPVASSLFGSIYEQLPNDSDFTLFKGAGMAGLNFAYIGDLIYYHSAHDSLDHVDTHSIQQHGDLMLGLAQHFGNRAEPLSANDNQVYFNLIGSLVIHYPQALTIPLSILIAILTLGAIALGFRAGRLTARGVGLGFAAMLLSLIAAILLVLGVWFIVQRIQSTYQFFAADVYASTIYFTSFALLAVAAVAGVATWVAHKTHIENLAAGALLWWLILLVLTTALIPGGSYLFGLPLGAASIGLGLSFSRQSLQMTSLQGLALIAGFGLPGLILLTPTIVLIFTALTVYQPIAGVALISLTCGLIVPVIIALGRIWRGALIGLTLAVGLALAIGHSLTQPFDAQNPVPTSLSYALDADSGQALWISSDSTPNTWTQTFLTDKPTRGTLQTFYPYSESEFLQHPAPPVALAVPTATVIEDSSSASMRTLRLHLSSSRGADRILVYLAEPTTVMTATINGQPVGAQTLDDFNVAGQLAISYSAPGREGFELMIGIPIEQRLRLVLIDESYALPAIANSMAPRPPMFMPDPYGFTDMTVVRDAIDF